MWTAILDFRTMAGHVASIDTDVEGEGQARTGSVLGGMAAALPGGGCARVGAQGALPPSWATAWALASWAVGEGGRAGRGAASLGWLGSWAARAGKGSGRAGSYLRAGPREREAGPNEKGFLFMDKGIWD